MTQENIKRLHEYIEKSLIDAEQKAPGGSGKYPFMVGYLESTLRFIKKDLATHLKPSKNNRK